jgi:hypothetical protein
LCVIVFCLIINITFKKTVHSVYDFFGLTVIVFFFIYPIFYIIGKPNDEAEKANDQHKSNKLKKILKIIIGYVVILVLSINEDSRQGIEISISNLHYFASFFILCLFLIYGYLFNKIHKKK